jgi:hypothetical protein
VQQAIRGVQEEMTNYLGADYGEHRRADAQTSCDSAGSSDPGHHRAEPLFITGDKTTDATLGEARIRAGEIIGWRFWKLCNGFLHSLFASYTWRPGEFERSSSKQCGFGNLRFQALTNPGYHAFRDKEQAEREAIKHACWSPSVIGSVAMWGEVIEHQHGWRSEYAAVRSITEIIGQRDFSSKQRLLLDLREKYRCTDSDRTMSDAAITVLAGESAGQSGKDSRWKSS